VVILCPAVQAGEKEDGYLRHGSGKCDVKMGAHRENICHIWRVGQWIIRYIHLVLFL
jgi:hypothetical protein